MNRQQRRSFNSQVRRLDASNKLEQAMGALSQIKEAGDVSKLAKDLHDQLEETKRITDAMVEDYETLATELEVREEVFLRLLAKYLLGPLYDTMPLTDRLRVVKEASDAERKKVLETRQLKEGT